MVALLDQLGLSHHVRSVVGLGCSSLRHLLDLTPSDMQAIGLAPLEARRLAQAIAGLRGQPIQAANVPSPTPSSPVYPTSSMAATATAPPPPSLATSSYNPQPHSVQQRRSPPPQDGSFAQPSQHIGSTLAAASAAAERQHGGAFAAVMRFAEKVGDDDLLSTVRSHGRGGDTYFDM